MIVPFHLDGIARKWFALLEANNTLSTWKNFVEVVVRKFTNLHYCLPGGKLNKLCQDGTVIDYQAKFEEMCTQILMGLPKTFILEMYISGFKDNIQAEVLRDKLSDIHEAFELSLLVESQQQGNKGGYYKPFVPKQAKLSTTLPNPIASTTPGVTPIVPHVKQSEGKLPVFTLQKKPVKVAVNYWRLGRQ